MGVLIKRGKFGQTHTQEEHHVKTEAEAALRYLHIAGAKDAGCHQKLGERHETDAPSEPPEGTDSVNTQILDFWPPRW